MSTTRKVFTVRLLVQLPQTKGAKKVQLLAKENAIFEFPSNKEFTEACKANKPVAVDVDIPELTYAMKLKSWSKDGYLKSTSQTFTLTELIMYEKISLICDDRNTGWVTLMEIPTASEQCQPLTDPFASSHETEIHKTFGHISDLKNLLQTDRLRDYASRFIPIKVYNAVDFLTVLLSSTWDMLSMRFPDVEENIRRIKGPYSTEHLKYMSYSVFEDLIIQLKNQMDYMRKWDNAPDSIFERLVRIILHTCLILFGWSRLYPLTNRDPLNLEWYIGKNESAPAAEAEIERLQRELIKLRVDIASHPSQSDPLPAIPANVKGKVLLEYLFNNAYREALNVEEKRPYQDLFLLLRGEDARWAYSRIDHELKERAADPSSDRRDALRRLLVHLVHASGRLPQFMWFTDELHSDNAQGERVGSFASVKRYYWRSGDRRKEQKVALKAFYNLHKGSNENEIKAFYLEFLFHLHLDHPNIIKVYGVPNGRDFPSLSIVMPYMDNGDILTYISKKGKRALIDKWILQVARGLRYLHQEKIVHGDLSTSNVLIDNDDNAVIVDLGSSVFVNGRSSKYHSRRDANSQYRAPELGVKTSDNKSPRPGKPSDVYSFGVFCIHLYIGRAPLRGEKNQIHSPDHFGMSPTLWSIIEQCVDSNKEARPTMETIVESMEKQGLGVSHADSTPS